MADYVVRARLAADPLSPAGLLEIVRVEPWTILLEHQGAGRTATP